MRLMQLALMVLIGSAQMVPSGRADASESLTPQIIDRPKTVSFSVTQIAEADKPENTRHEFSLDDFPNARDRVLSPTDSMLLGADSEPWLPRIIDVLKKNRPPLAIPETVALIDGEGGTRYLVLDWINLKRGGLHGASLPLEIHKIVRTEQEGTRLKWLRSFDYLVADLYPPTGQTVFGGEAPIAVIFVWTGGSHPASTGLRLIQMKKNSVDITPDWAGRTVNVTDLDGDGAFEVVALDERWRGFFDGNHGPYVPVVLSRADGHWFNSCRRFAGLYRQRLKKIEDWAQRPAFAQHIHRLVYQAEAYLTHIQLGAVEDARKDLTKLISLAESQPKYGVTPDDVRRTFEPVLIEAMEMPDSPCMVTATKSGRHRDGSVTSFGRHFESRDD